MSILTKIFVVLVTVLSVGLVAMIVPFVYKTEKYQEKYQDEVHRRRQAEDASALLQQTVQAIAASSTEQSRLLREENTKLKSDVSRLQGDRANLESQLALERGTGITMQGQLNRLAAALSQQTDLGKVLQQEISERRDKGEKDRIAMIELNDRNNQLQTQNDVLTQIVKRTAEELASAEETNIKLNNQLATVPAEYRDRNNPNAVPIEAAVKIEGQITQTRKIDTCLLYTSPSPRD